MSDDRDPGDEDVGDVHMGYEPCPFCGRALRTPTRTPVAHWADRRSWYGVDAAPIDSREKLAVEHLEHCRSEKCREDAKTFASLQERDPHERYVRACIAASRRLRREY